MIGIFGATNGPMPTLESYSGRTYTDQGISGTCIATGVSNLPAWLSTYTPSRVYNNYGTNDIGCAAPNNCGSYCPSPDSLSQWLADYQIILTYVKNAGATLYPMEITPRNGGANETKIRNASLADFSFINNLPMAPRYLEMTDQSNDDNILPAYNSQGDGLHPGAAGDVVLGYLMYKSAVPTRSRDWGNSAYPNFGHESWSWWLITNTSGNSSIVGGMSDSVTGHLNGGVLTLVNGDYAVSDVVAILPNSNYVSVTLTTAQGTPVIYYRTSTTNFARTSATSSSSVPVNAGAWTTYTGAFTLTAGSVQFIQIKIANASATQLQVSKATLNWNVTPRTTYSITGTISGAVQSGVTITLTGTSSASTTTASDGTYSFTGLSTGSYTITPGKGGYTFSPTSLNPIITTANITGDNFTASAVVASGSSGVAGSFSGTVQ
jgi:hypothetical protein